MSFEVASLRTRSSSNYEKADRRRRASSYASVVIGTSDRDLLSINDTDAAQGPRHVKELFKTMIQEQFGIRNRLGQILDGNTSFNLDAAVSKIYRTSAVLMVIFSTLTFVVQSYPQYFEPELNNSGPFFLCEIIAVTYFTLDFILRALSTRSIGNFLSIGTLIDFISFVGFYVEQIINAFHAYPQNSAGFTLIRVLRLARISRLLRLSRSQRGLSILWEVVLKSKDGLFLLVVLCGIATIVFASILYYIEISTCSFDIVTLQWIRPDGSSTPFQSIPHTFWFIAMTITTVGYGDQVPGNTGGRAWTIIVMLFGVLVLSFPNILIGSNFSDVHRKFSREQARTRLGRMFRRVRMAVRLVRLWREFRVKGHIDYGNRPENENVNASFRYRGIISKTTNFMFRLSDYPERSLYDAPEKVLLGALDLIVHGGVSLLSLLQRLLEGFSGTATIEELTQSYHYFPQKEGMCVTNAIIFELSIRAAATALCNLFVLSRDYESGLLQLTKRGANALQNFAESNAISCMRCVNEAKDIWTQTTRQMYADFLPMDGYRNWQSVQQRTRKRFAADFVFDLKNSEAMTKNNIFRGIEPRKLNAQNIKAKCRCRYCNSTWGLDAALRPECDTCFKPDVEFLELEVIYAQNTVKIFHLDAKLKLLQKDKKIPHFAAVPESQSGMRSDRSPDSNSLQADVLGGSGVFGRSASPDT